MNNMQLIGDIYIKVNPDVKSKYNLTKGPISITVRENSITKEIPILNDEDIEKLDSEYIEELKSKGFIKEHKETIDNTNGFWRIFPKNYDFIMENITSNEEITCNKSDVDINFINLFNWLKQANYVGRKLIPKDTSLPPVEALYFFEGTYLIKTSATYTILNNETLSAYYSFGEILPYYYEKEELYQNIVHNIILQKGLTK